MMVKDIRDRTAAHEVQLTEKMDQALKDMEMGDKSSAEGQSNAEADLNLGTD